MKKGISILLSLMIIFGLFSGLSFSVSATEDESAAVGASSGTTGDCMWMLDDEGTLTINGNGEMGDYDYWDNPVPWGTSIKNVVIENGVKNVGKSAFNSCADLTSVDISDSVTSIGDGAFSSCRNLTSATIGNGVTSIGDSAFSNCSMLKNIEIPDSVINLGFSAFKDCSSLTNITLSKNIEIIRAQTFLDCTSLKNIIIPDSVTSIGYIAFHGCTGLTNVTFGNGITNIGEQAFRNCTNLDNVNIPNNVKKIESCAFYDCKSLTSITIPESITTIEQATFRGCTGLKSVTIPKSITRICDDAFYDCTSLSGVYISDLTAWCNISFGNSTYYGGTPLTYTSNLYLNNVLITNLVIPDSITEIRYAAFYNCKNIKTLTIPDSVTTINHYAFYGCTSLTNINIPNSVTYLGFGLFSGCTGLKSVSIPNNITSIQDNAFFGCTNLTNISIPSNVTSIGSHAFSRTGLTNIIIPDSVTFIGSYAFSYCEKLRSITIPATVNYFATGLFSGDKSLCDIYYGGSKDNWEKIQYEDIYGNDRKFMNTITIHYNCNYSSKHIIDSDYGDDHKFFFGDDEEIEDLVFSKASTEYNPRLAHFLACMARSAYTRELANNNYMELGFSRINQFHYGVSDPYAGYTIGEKDLGNGNKLVMITIRGSSDITEWLGTDFNLGNDSMIYSHGWHSGFSASTEMLMESLKSYLGGNIQTNGITYIITGHSLGAAVGNLLAVKLYEAGVSGSKVYDYNFACPNVAMGPDDSAAWNYQGRHNNIINVGNWCDYVTHVPGAGMEAVSIDNRMNMCDGWAKWKKYGVSYWFNNGFQGIISHDMGVYLDYLEKEYDESHFSQSEYKIKSVNAWCPVDVTIYDNQGNPIAGTTNNEPNYYGYAVGEKAYIYVSGDRKLFHIIGTNDFEVKLQGTDNGEMEFGIASEDMTNSESHTEKWFKSVQLTEGKEMTSFVTDYLDASDTQLFFVDDNKIIEQEILGDGTEVNPIFVSESKVELLYGSKVTLAAESADEYRWYSTDESVATVQNGVVTARGNGEANIVAETVNGARAICKIIVHKILGDVNGDNSIDVLDATVIQKYSVGKENLSEDQLEVGDVNNDSVVDILDATEIQKYAVGKIIEFKKS